MRFANKDISNQTHEKVKPAKRRPLALPPYDLNLGGVGIGQRRQGKVQTHLEIEGDYYTQYRFSPPDNCENVRLTVIIDEQPQCASTGLFADVHFDKMLNQNTSTRRLGRVKRLIPRLTCVDERNWEFGQRHRV